MVVADCISKQNFKPVCIVFLQLFCFCSKSFQTDFPVTIRFCQGCITDILSSQQRNVSFIRFTRNLHTLLRIHQLHLIIIQPGRVRNITRITYRHTSRFTFFRRDHNHTIGSLYTVDCSRNGIFQHGD